ncbi:MAG TPA: DUF5011 domain-containing protein [Candidatus Blautia pullicola]|uniref:DUF5011 domain-containing protein n=1 Tax=Candidatus Blautia pullicola TaxID=2838498 RepID=A0A9D2JTA4_9FIRM|nr:DUF5011 domain-containing protein [Candidatus Blautia pullicola]
MRFVRTGVIILFILSLGIYLAAQGVQMRNRDPHVPEITSDREILEIPCAYSQEQLLEGMAASDREDGDLTSQIVAGSFSRFIEPGVCNLTYVVFDSANQPASLTRKVKFTDYHSPRFTLSEPLVFAIDQGGYSDAMGRIGAQDMLDGNRKEWITQTDTNVSYQKAGSYTMTVEVSNSFGDTVQAALPVHVVEPEALQLSIQLSQTIVYIKQGEAVNPQEYVTELVNTAGDVLDVGLVSAESSVDSQTPGCYEIHYQATDAEGRSGETWLTVVVEA